MMEIEKMKAEIMALLRKSNPAIELNEESEDIFTPKFKVAPRDMLVVCMELKKKYELDLNVLVDNLHSCSLNEIAEAICAQLV